MMIGWWLYGIELHNRGLSESIVRIRINGIKPSSRTQDGFEHGSYENMVAGPHFSHAEGSLKNSRYFWVKSLWNLSWVVEDVWSISNFELMPRWTSSCSWVVENVCWMRFSFFCQWNPQSCGSQLTFTCFCCLKYHLYLVGPLRPQAPKKKQTTYLQAQKIGLVRFS